MEHYNWQIKIETILKEIYLLLHPKKWKQNFMVKLMRIKT